MPCRRQHLDDRRVWIESYFPSHEPFASSRRVWVTVSFHGNPTENTAVACVAWWCCEVTAEPEVEPTGVGLSSHTCPGAAPALPCTVTRVWIPTGLFLSRWRPCDTGPDHQLLLSSEMCSCVARGMMPPAVLEEHSRPRSVLAWKCSRRNPPVVTATTLLSAGTVHNLQNGDVHERAALQSLSEVGVP